jgi:hypothetical protein
MISAQTSLLLPLPLSSSLLSSSLLFIRLGRKSHFYQYLHFTSQRAIPFNSSKNIDEYSRRFFAGHSHWANIKRAKGAADIKKANVFLKISLEITTAVRGKRLLHLLHLHPSLLFTHLRLPPSSCSCTYSLVGGSSDPQMNPRLATALDKARSHNMPKETIEGAIKKASQAKGILLVVLVVLVLVLAVPPP